MRKEAILIHGWDPNYYNENLDKRYKEDIAWGHRLKLIDLLGQRFDLTYFNLPGFCGVPEPPVVSYDVEDFTDYFASWMNESNRNPEIIIGYSFGGVLALDYKMRYQSKAPIILISPAIKRQESFKSELGHKAKKLIPSSMLTTFKHLYQTLSSRYYRRGTSFLRLSYDRIVRRDFSSSLDEVDPGGILLIYGRKDTTTPFSVVKDRANKVGFNYHLISEGGHDIGQTHPEEIMEAIDNFLIKKQ